MKKTKKVFALLSSSLLLGSIVMSPVAGWTEKVEAKEAETRVDWSLVNENALIQHLKEKGKLDQDASPEEINQAVKEYVMDGSVPFSQTEGIDTSSKFGEEAYKGKKKIQQKVFDKISKIDENTVQALKENKKSFNDRAVVALIEFPDFPHNSIKKKENQFWVKDFNPEHYEQLLFNRDGFTMDNGRKSRPCANFISNNPSGTGMWLAK